MDILNWLYAQDTAETRVAYEEITKLRAKKFANFNNEDCWIYQGDGMDNLHSLVCPVVISAAELEALREDAKRWQVFVNLWLMCVEIAVTQDEDGGFSITPVEFVENILMNPLKGNTPEEAIDQAIDKARG